LAATPKENAQPAHDEKRRVRFVLVSRAIVVPFLAGVTVFFNLRAGRPVFSASGIFLYAVVAGSLLFSLGCYVWLRQAEKALGLHIQIQVIFDVLVATSLVYVTGGVESPLTFFYALPMITSAIFFSRRGTYLTAGLSCLFLGALMILESRGILPADLDHRVKDLPTAARVAYLLAFNYAVFLFVATLAGYLGGLLRKTRRELKVTEDHLDNVSALNRDIVLSLRSGLVAMDERGRISLVNPVAEEILGCEAKKVLLGSGFDLLPVLTAWKDFIVGVQSQTASHQFEVRYVRPTDGHVIPLDVTLSWLSNRDGTKAGTLVHIQDLSRMKEMEALMKKSERLAALGELAAGIAHEIRNPLASISGSVQVLKDLPNLAEPDRRLLEIVLRETNRLDALVADFLMYAKPREPNLTETLLNVIVEETVGVFLSGCASGRTDIQMELEETHAKVDPDQIRQVLWNLLANAVDAIRDSGTIGVRLRSENAAGQNRSVVLEVEDNGPGVLEELRNKIFDPFFTTKEGGSGLGLAIVSRIVEAHRGTIEVRNMAAGESSFLPEGGCRFSVRLPGVRR
jgi:two-component system, NtrC family, sensor histidine kinase PilS